MSFTNKIIAETQQSQELRTPLLQKLSEYYNNRYVVAFYTSFSVPDGDINDIDVEILESLLSENIEHINDNGILLVINSPGGNPLSAERFIKVCREYSKNNYIALVPHQAKSAATMISLGAKEIFMTNTSELGPIDIQVPWKDSLIPAYSIIDAYENLMKKGISLKEEERIEPILQQLADFDASSIESLRNIRELSSEIAKKVMASGMFSGLHSNTIQSLLKIFIDPSELKTHGRPIYYSDLIALDKQGRYCLNLIDTNESVFPVIQEYHIRATACMRNTMLSKMLESVDNGFKATSAIATRG